jgi:hypothetical protein
LLNDLQVQKCGVKAARFQLRGGIAINRDFLLMMNVTQVMTRDATINWADVREGRAFTENGKELQGPRISVEDAHFSPARRGTALIDSGLCRPASQSGIAVEHC